MVSLITDGRSTDDQGRPFRHRRSLPVVALICVLAVLGAMIWFRILTKPDELSAPVDCNPPTTSTPVDPNAPVPQPLGTPVSSAKLVDTQPAPLAATKVRVFNANGERGQAVHVASQLSDYGFAAPPDVQAGNDPVYVDQNMQCQGQIRFGAKGLAAASAVWLVAPCAQLIEDGRVDDTVDLALGTYSVGEIKPDNDAKEVLASLKDTSPTGAGGGAPVDSELLKAARSASC